MCRRSLRTRKVLVLNAIQHDSHNGCIHKGSPVLTQVPLDGIQLQSKPAAAVFLTIPCDRCTVYLSILCCLSPAFHNIFETFASQSLASHELGFIARHMQLQTPGCLMIHVYITDCQALLKSRVLCSISESLLGHALSCFARLLMICRACLWQPHLHRLEKVVTVFAMLCAFADALQDGNACCCCKATGKLPTTIISTVSSLRCEQLPDVL